MTYRDRVAFRLTGFAVFALGLVLALAPPGAAQDGAPRVLVASVDGTITPVMAGHVDDAVARAERDGYEALVIRLDTPGGLDSSMRDIAQTLLNADVPTVVWVGPSGARAASAGAIITLASHVAAMAPGTNIGAATPIDLEGGDLGEKVRNDAAAYAESVARARGRDVEFARDAVLEGESITAGAALERGVIEVIAGDVDDLLGEVDGRTVELRGGREVVLATAGAAVDDFDLGFFRSIQQWLADPNLAFLFLSVGTLAILYEFANPGVGAGGIVGAIMLVLAFFSLSVLPVNVAGILLMVLAGALFLGELFVPGIGVMAVGGAVSLVLSGILLFRGSTGVDPAVLWPTAVVVGGGAVLLGRMAWRTRRAPRRSGGELLVGQTVTVRSVGEHGAQAFVEGAYWNVRRADDGPLETGQTVTVVGIDGLDLVVEPASPAPEGSDAPGEPRTTPEQPPTHDQMEGR